MKITRGSGNVFEDLGLPDPEAARVKALDREAGASVKPLPWLARGCTPVYPLTVLQAQIEQRGTGCNPLELAAIDNHGTQLLRMYPCEAVYGDVDINICHRDASAWLRDWTAGRPVYPITFLLEEF